MDEKAALKGQSFTLAVLGGLVALFAFFFILGMIVGRGQNLQISGDDAEQVPAGQPAGEDGEEAPLDYFETVTAGDGASTVEPAPAPAPEPVRTAPAAVPVPAQSPAMPGTGDVAIMLQLGAFGAEATAESMVAEVQGRGFPAVMMRPQPGESSRLYRVQVGPYTSADQAQRAQSQLQAAGYEVLVR